MNGPRLTALLAMGFFLVAPVGLGRNVAGRQLAPSVGSITRLIEPMVRQVVQRRDDNVGNVLVIGTTSGNVDGFEGRSFLEPFTAGTALGWTPLIDVTIAGGNFVGIFRQPAGGFYDMQFRPVFRGVAGAPVTALAVGVGEVFLTAGQSNTTNWALPTGFVPDERVSSFFDGTGHGLNTNYPGSSWRFGMDPQPSVVDESGGSSPWPTMATNLIGAFDVPIGLYSLGCTATTVEQWQPGATVSTLTAPNVPLFGRLINAINYFKVRSGFRAVLWDQGESDTASETAPPTYELNLFYVIAQSRALTGYPVKWMVAQAAGPPSVGVDPALQAGIRQAQANVCDGSSVFLGPNTDSLGMEYRQSPPGLAVHFTAAGIEKIGGYWGIYVFNTPHFLDPGFLPPR